MSKPYGDLKKHSQMKIDGMMYLEKAITLSPDSVRPYLNSDDLEKIKCLDAIKKELKDTSIPAGLSAEIDKKFVEISIEKCRKGLRDKGGDNWMIMLLSVAQDIQDKTINDDNWRQKVNTKVKTLFDYYLERSNGKYPELPIQGKQPIMNKRDEWERIFHHMLEMRYAPRGESNPIVGSVLDMLKNESSQGTENRFYAKCLLRDFYIKELAFAKAALSEPERADKIETIHTELIKLCDEILKEIPKIDKQKQRKLQVFSEVDIVGMRKECLLTLKNIKNSEIGLTENVATAGQILKREQSMLSRFFQSWVNRDSKKRTASNDQEIELTPLKNKKAHR